MRILGIDYGKAKIGVAISDELKLFAHPLQSINADNSINEIKEILEEYEVSEIVIGFPRTLKGMDGKMAENTKIFTEKLKKNVNARISIWDERLSTKQAENIMIKADVSRKKRKVKIDSLAAAIMLQSYLDRKKNK